MGGEIAAVDVLVSVAGMLLIAARWNLPMRSILVAVLALAAAAAMPFLRLYQTLESGWTLALGAIGQIVLSLALATALVLIRFWRDPERIPPPEKDVIVSPADGSVIFVKSIPRGILPLVTKNGRDYSLLELAGTEVPDKSVWMIGIDMNILDVHVNRCPIGGHVEAVRHVTGKFISLRRYEAPFVNARCTTSIKNAALTVVIVQIASRLVRRVDNYLHPKQEVLLGQRLGMIRFGSQVDVLFPSGDDVKVEVCAGQTVRAGTSVLARYR